MNDDEILAQYHEIERKGAAIPGMIREATERTLRIVNPGRGRGMVLWSDLDADSVDAAIDAELARFAGLGQTVEWKVHGYDQPDDLRQRLGARHFVAEPDEALVVLDLEHVPEPRRSAAVVRELEGPDEFDLAYEIHTDAFGKRSRAWIDALKEEKRQAPEEVRMFVVWIDGEPAAGGWVRLRANTPFASLWGGGTVTKFRRRGAYRALVDARLALGKEAGYRYALVDAGPESLPILERLGFRVLTWMHPMVWRP